MEKKILELRNASIGYGREVILKDVNFVVQENDFIGVAGPNGAGKTTLLRSVLGTLPLLGGTRDADGLRIGYVPQRDTVQPLLPYTVIEVVMMGRYPLLRTFQRPGRVDRQIAAESLDKVKAGDLINKNFNSLSGGQRQRVLIARALSVNPSLLILDEPTNGMDTPSHYSLLELIENIHTNSKTAILLVSHLLADVANSAKKIALVERGGFFWGVKEEVLTEELLSRIYGAPMSVSIVDDEYIIHPRKRGA